MSAAGELQIGSWSQLSLMPEATREGLVQLLAYAALFLVAVQRITSTLSDVRRLLRWIAWSTAAMAAFGLVQYLTSNGKFFWFYQHPFVSTSDSVHGAFSNRNHFAHFMALGLGPADLVAARQLAGKIARTRRCEADWLVLLLGIVLFAALMSFSRGGALAMMAAVVTYLAVGWRASLLSRRFILGRRRRSCSWWSRCCWCMDTRAWRDGWTIWPPARWSSSINCKAAARSGPPCRRQPPTFPLFGAGVGTHSEIYHRYLDRPSDTEYTHAESGYLQVAEETGLLGVALLLAGMSVCVAGCLRTLRDKRASAAWPPLAAIAASLTASVVHSLYDFVWYVPSCTAIVAPARCLRFSSSTCGELTSGVSSRSASALGLGGRLLRAA